jgi:hypothetical protein
MKRGAPRVVRGGSWNNRARNLRCAYRNRNDPGNRNDNLGFRVVCRGSRQHVAARLPRAGDAGPLAAPPAGSHQ